MEDPLVIHLEERIELGLRGMLTRRLRVRPRRLRRQRPGDGLIDELIDHGVGALADDGFELIHASAETRTPEQVRRAMAIQDFGVRLQPRRNASL